MSEIPDRFLVHRVNVEDIIGTGAYGDEYQPRLEPVACFRDDKRRLVRNGSDGEEVVSETTLLMKPGVGPVTDSRVDLGDGDFRQVVALSRHDDGGLGAWQHDEVSLT